MMNENMRKLKYMKNKKVGSTPIIYSNKIYYKLEMFNPTGSIKDRAAYNILENYFKLKKLKENDTIVIATSGNMGISLAYFGKKFKINTVIVMPENVSEKRIKILKKYHATIILTSSKKGMIGSIEEAEKIAKDNNYVLINQFDNIYNKQANYQTGKEIYEDLPNVDYIICGIGTSGTIMGIAEYFKHIKKEVKIIGVEPFENAVINEGVNDLNLIQGLGAGFLPPLLNLELIDEVRMVKSSDVINTFENNNPLLLGLSSVANWIVALNILENVKDAVIVVICADGMDRYESDIN